ncbi:MAG: hypothetical protein RLZZ628_3809 [Bacteroidota bacterium]|jgi:hypothetical protein
MKSLSIPDKVLEKYYKQELSPTEALQVERYLFEKRSFEYERQTAVKALLETHLMPDFVVNQSDIEMPISEARHLMEQKQAITKTPTGAREGMKARKSQPNRQIAFKITFYRVAAALTLPVFFFDTYIYRWFQAKNTCSCFNENYNCSACSKIRGS